MSPPTPPHRRRGGPPFRSRATIAGAGRAALLFVIAAPAALLWACSEPSPTGDGEPAPGTPVQVVRVERRDLEDALRAVGTLEASEAVTVRPEVADVVEAVHFREGRPVAEGELLVSLEDDEIRHRLDARRAALAAARAEAENSRRMLDRRETLLDQEVIPPETFEEVQTAYETAVARRERLAAEVQELAAALDNADIRSPIGGIAGERLVEVGDFVEVGEALVTVVRTDVLEVDFTVPGRYANRVREGQTVTIRTAAAPDRPVEGKVFFVSPLIRETTRDLLLKARVDNPDGGLRPGAFVTVELTLDVREQALVLPEEALVPRRTGFTVFVVEGGRAHRRDVEIGLRRPGLVEIRSGLEAGETVIRAGHLAVSDGDRVRTAEEGSGGGGS